MTTQYEETIKLTLQYRNDLETYIKSIHGEYIEYSSHYQNDSLLILRDKLKLAYNTTLELYEAEKTEKVVDVRAKSVHVWRCPKCNKENNIKDSTFSPCADNQTVKCDSCQEVFYSKGGQ